MRLCSARTLVEPPDPRVAATAAAVTTAAGFALAKLGVADAVAPALLWVAGLIVAVGCFAVGHSREPATGAVVVAAGPVVGFGGYLGVYRLFEPASTDSPTWLLFVAFTAGALGLGAVAAAAGRAIGWSRSSQ